MQHGLSCFEHSMYVLLAWVCLGRGAVCPSNEKGVPRHACHQFHRDLAVIMLVAGVVTILFHRFKQPVVLGYIVAGFIIGPHTPPFGLIHDEDTIKTLAELG